MYQINNELLGRMYYEDLLKEAKQERLALQAKSVEQRSPHQSMVYLIGSSLVQLGQRLEHVGTSHITNPSPPATL